jgi:hypothetical protein
MQWEVRGLFYFEGEVRLRTFARGPGVFRGCSGVAGGAGETDGAGAGEGAEGASGGDEVCCDL